MNKIAHCILAGTALAIALLAVNLNGERTMKKEAAHKVVAMRVEEMYNRDSHIADAIFHPDCVHHINGSEEKLQGPEAIQESIRQLRENFASFRTTIDDILAEGDLVAFRWTWAAKLKGSGLDYTLHGNTVFRFKDNKVIEAWAIDDRLREMQRLGYSLVPPAAAEKK